MNSRKTFLIVAIVAIALAMFTTSVFASANDDLYSFAESVKVTVDGKEYKASSSQLLALKQYLNSHELTDEKVSAVKASVNSIVSTVESEKTVDASKLTNSAKDKIKSEISKIEDAMNVTITYSATHKTFTVKDSDGKTLTEFTVTAGSALVQTGSSYVPYIVASGVALIAIAALVTMKVRN